MKTFIKAFSFLLLMSAAGASQAWWGNNGWGNGWNPYDVWDPRYWMEEMEQAFDDDDWYGPYGPYGGGPYGYGPYGGGPYGYGPGPYGGGPYGYSPYGGAPYGAPPPYGYGY